MVGRPEMHPRKGHKRWIVILLGMALLATELTLGAAEETCNCSTAIDFDLFQTELVPEICCVNLSRTNIATLDWSVFARIAGLRELYLSNCGISDIIRADNGSSTLEILYLDHNQLSKLPDSFLKNAPSLRVLQLESNQLQKLPETFLEASDQIQEIHLDSNNLTSLPSGVFKSSLLELGLSNNSWDCTCTLFGNLDNFQPAPLDTEIICSTPQRFHGLNLKDIPRQELCRNHALTALFISLPLVAVLLLVTCCFCKQKKKTGYALRGGKESRLATVERNGGKGSGDHHGYTHGHLPTASAAESEKNILLRNQVLLKPSIALLGSNRDLYEEIEIKLGASDDSIMQGNLDQDKSGSDKLAVAEESVAGGESEAETVSVTDVLKDSADREKFYMNQSVDYYNLVPGIELEDSDHMEYENVDLC
ncbi:pollen receptor-like kinase 6 isoform X1 [Sceloporus undulatus]|uniref:pollen receptor-like kinase 6 isoform X1 n=1 Tax=Sceloporus undulatus TaxID=8520 RepID=UPI001C4B6C8F|nr:pollen receptor-like kinase 6 isoform X1 [Sceloporus undulatus]